MRNKKLDISTDSDEITEGKELSNEINHEKLDDLEARLANAEEMMKKLQDNYLRAIAETDNIRKRNQREKEEYLRFASLSIIRKLLDISDDFTRAIEDSEKNQDFDSLSKGVAMIFKKFTDVIDGEGVVAIDALGQPFDPEFHNPLMMEASSEPENTVIEELQKGYIMYGRVIRPSLVKVSN